MGKVFLILILFSSEGQPVGRAVKEVPSVAECHRLLADFQSEENMKTLSADMPAIGAACEVHFEKQQGAPA